MVKLGKWIGAGLGWAFGGPIGALLGFIIGGIVDATRVVASNSERIKNTTTRGDFILSFLVLSAAVMKADKVVKKSEIDYVKNFLLANFGEQETFDALKILKELLQKEIPIDEVCSQVRYNMTKPLKLQIVHYLYGIADADGEIHVLEIEVIEQIAIKIGLTAQEHNSVKSMFVNHDSNDSAYEILGIDRTASVEQIKKAYRAMAIKYHPDKVASLGEDIQNAAKQKFQTLNEAYEKIKKERKFV